MLTGPPDDPTGFDFTRSQDLFINGLLDGTGGTCTSMPVLYVAIGRRLGYPLKLVAGTGHLFLRWDDSVTGERFNIEGTSRGFLSHPDEQYINWPRKPARAEIEGGYLLKSMTPREELAAFLDSRGTCLLHSGRLSDAAKAYRTAVELSPRFLPARLGVDLAEGLMKSRNAETDPEVIYELVQRHQRANAGKLRAGMPEVRPPSATGVSVRTPIVVDPMPVIQRSPTGPEAGVRA